MSAPQSHKGIILVADDNEANRETTLCFAGRRGFTRVRPVQRDGQQALAPGE